jgi:hypothetical protein
MATAAAALPSMAGLSGLALPGSACSLAQRLLCEAGPSLHATCCLLGAGEFVGGSGLVSQVILC